MALASAALVAGCSAGSPKSSPPSSQGPALKSMTVAQACSDLSDLRNLFAQVGYDASLTATRTDLGRLVTTASTDLEQGPPAAISTAVASVVADLKVVNEWVQTKATQTELDNNQQPANVKSRFTDVGTQYKKIDGWSTRNCR